MIPRSMYPEEPWPLDKLAKHPCLPLLVADAKNPATKAERAKELLALVGLLQTVQAKPDKYAPPLLVADAFDGIDAGHWGFVIDELARLRLFRVEIIDCDATLIPCTQAGKAKRVGRIILSASVPTELATAVREASRINGVSVSSIIEAALVAYLGIGA